MSQYITPADMLSFGAREIAQAARPDDGPKLVPELLRLTIDGGDRSAYSADEQGGADGALARLETVIDRAEGVYEDHCRHRYALPLHPVGEQDKGTMRDLARYYLYEDRADENVKDRYEAALGHCRAIAAGRVILLAAPAASGAGAGMPAFDTGGQNFGADDY